MRHKDETKEQIIFEAALRLIVQVGLSGLKMSDLAKEAGVAIGTLYVYFESKEVLVVRLYEYLIKISQQNVAQVFDEDDALKIKIKKITRSYLNSSMAHPEYGAFLEQYYRSSYFLENTTIQIEENQAVRPIFILLKEGQKQGVFKETDSDLLVSLVTGMLNEVAKQAFMTNTPVTDDYWNQIFAVIWDGIRS
jgi:TetR/AcrR family transcriptional regulator, multidrug resistance operon repressor